MQSSATAGLFCCFSVVPPVSRAARKGHVMSTRLAAMTTPSKTRRRFTGQQKADAIALCLQGGPFLQALIAHPLRLPSSSLSSWVSPARIDRGQPAPHDQGQLSTEERVPISTHVSRFFGRSGVRWMFQAGGSALCSGAKLFPVCGKSSCRRESSPAQIGRAHV